MTSGPLLSCTGDGHRHAAATAKKNAGGAAGPVGYSPNILASEDGSVTRYRTIVADPPWAYPEGWASHTPSRPRTQQPGRRSLPYGSMTVDEIAAMPVGAIADRNAHLYLWTTNRYVFDAQRVIEAWGFRYAQMLVWAKPPKGINVGGAFAQSAEFVLFCRRGSLRAKERVDSVWFNWPRTHEHSRKPDAFLDLVERVSPGPYAELFARRARFGWDYPIGDQALGGVAA